MPDTALPSAPSPIAMTGHHVSLLLKGDSGSGKTETSMSFPGPIHVAQADANSLTMKRAATRRGDVTIDVIENWSSYADDFIPKVINRSIDAATIVVDTIDFASDHLWQKIQGGKSSLTIPDYGTGLRALKDTTLSLVSATHPKGDHPGYHVVFTSHLRDITDDGGAMLRRAPALLGQFANKIEDYFDYVFLCEGKVTSSIQSVAGSNTTVRGKEFILHTIGPDRYNTCKGGGLPPSITVPENASAFEMLNEWWKL